MFGPFELQIANLWRSIFLDLDAWTATIQAWRPSPRRILEVGCGEGYSTALLARAFPDVPVLAIDVGQHIGRLYDGPVNAAQFRVAFAEELAQEQPGQFDLVVLTDVLHHVPVEGRRSLLEAIRTLLAEDGILAFKDWHRNRTPIYYACYAADRWLTGDKVAYLTSDEAEEMIAAVFGTDAINKQETIGPWINNYAFKIVSQ